MINEERGYREKVRMGNNALFWIKLANNRLSELNKQLLSLAMLLLPLTASIVVIPPDDLKLKECNKDLLKYGWLFLGISIVAGLIQVVVEAHYFKRLSNDSSQRERFFDELPFDSADKANRKLKSVPGQSTHIPLHVQVYTLFAGLLLIMIVALELLLAR